MRPPTRMELIKERHHGAKLIGYDQHPGWNGELPFYEWKCKEHGIVQNYEQGYDYSLECPECQKKRLAEGFGHSNTQTL
jgi:hypothetical protein